MQRLTLAALILVLAVSTATPADATLNACAAGKQRCVAKKSLALLTCHARAEKLGVDALTFPSVQACLQKATEKFEGAKGCFAKLHAKYGGLCLTGNDTGTIETLVDDFVLDAVTDLDPGYPTPVQNACSAYKKRCVGKKAAALLACHAKSTKPPGVDPAKLAACLQKARDKFDGGAVPAKGCFEKLENKYAAACLTVDDTAALEGKVDAFVQSVLCALDPGAEPCPDATPTPVPTSGCCQLAFACGGIPPGNAGDCSIVGGTVWPGYVCYPIDDPDCPIPDACGACGLPPTPTPTPTP